MPTKSETSLDDEHAKRDCCADNDSLPSPPAQQTTLHEQGEMEFRKLLRSVLKRPVSEGMLKRALCHYNLEIPSDLQSLATWPELVKIFKLTDIAWSDEYERNTMLRYKLRFSLKEILKRYG